MATQPILSVDILLEENEINTAERLLYETYVTEMGWNIPSPNPSDLRVTQELNPRVTDKYRSDCLWFGVYDSGVVPTVLVACHRARLPISSQFEISNYVDISRLFSEKNNICLLYTSDAADE